MLLGDFRAQCQASRCSTVVQCHEVLPANVLAIDLFQIHVLL